MTSHESAKRFEAARQRHLIEATIETLAEVGFKAASLNEIARRAKVSTGLFAHYFRDKDGLLEATLRFMAARLARSTALRLRAASTRRERLYAVGEAALADEEFDRRTSAVWLAFWGQMTHSERYQRVQHIYQKRMTSNLRHALRGLVPPERVGTHAILIAATIDGLWLRSHVPDPATKPISSGNARALVRALIDGLLAGASPFDPAPILIDASRRSTALVHRLDLDARAPSALVAEGERKTVGRPARGAINDWEALAAPDRARVLSRCAEALRAEGSALARLESSETGRPLRVTTGPDLTEAVVRLEAAARLALSIRTVRTELYGGRIGELRCGRGDQIATDIHWSRPILDLCARARALALGDTVIVRSSPYTDKTIARLITLFAGAGLPEGALTLDRGQPSLIAGHVDAGDLIVSHLPKRLKDAAAPFGRVGPKASTIILPGADMTRAARAVLAGCRSWTGSTFPSQNCVYVHEAARADFIDAITAAAAALQIGDPLAEETEVGPLLSRAHAEWLADLLAADLSVGARLIVGGAVAPSAPDEPAWLTPTIVDGCQQTSVLVRAHSFAPVVTLLPFPEEAALAALGRDDARAVGVFVDDPDRVRHIIATLDRPLSFINDGGVEPEAWSWEDSVAGAAVEARLRRIVIADRWPLP